MKSESLSPTSNLLLAFALVFSLVAFATPQVRAQTFNVMFSFTGGNDGAGPLAGLVIDPTTGNLYGTTNVGGSFGYGVVFELSPSGVETVLYNFTGRHDGGKPDAKLLIDAKTHNLYGTTLISGDYDVGTVFELSPTGVLTVLYTFTGGTDGGSPQASLIMDRVGNLYGTTSAGGATGNGVVFELSPNGVETVLYSFAGGTDGAIPLADVTMDKEGNLYGTTSSGGTDKYGTIFELARVPVPSPTASSPTYTWKENILHNFTHQDDGDVPYGGLTLDKAGNLYGTATGGGTNSGGTVFELTPSDGGWNFTVLYGLAGWDISGTYQDVLLDASGNIYGTTHCDGSYAAGTVYELTRVAGTWTYNSLYVFTGETDGLYSFSNLVFDKQGNLYGTTGGGGAYGYGAVFKVTP